MSRFGRTLFGTLAVLSLLLFLATAALWIESGLRSEWSPRSYRSGVDLTFRRNRATAHIGPYNVDGGLTWTLPYWKILLITGPVPVLWLRRLRGRESHAMRGLCRECGYDLRATPDRCPECGTVRAHANAGERKAEP